MAFIDEVQLQISAGNGGDGVVRWRREKYRPLNGPGGGDGGDGGDVYAEVVADLAYLDYYTRSKKFKAEHGDPGGNNGKEGKNGSDLTLKFPRGTVLKNLETGQEFELGDIGERTCILKGGRGGLGNEHFKSSTNTTPMEWTPGTPGEEATFDVELRLFADVGFIGLPSAGKSTLLNALTNAKSKVGAYHFTTLDPHLGAMHGYVLADIPGIIEGASAGKGLGHKFLRHIRRTKALVHLVGLDSEHPLEDYKTIRKEIEEYGEGLDIKSEIILLSKNDMVDATEIDKVLKQFKDYVGHDMVYTMTAYDEDSIKSFKDILTQYLESEKKENQE
ncbi:MAG: GTPase ObgE [Candidatus Pacebacteria bacterium]|nr:GTPase ObgE [Candidatus Paceibacterota bacterium]